MQINRKPLLLPMGKQGFKWDCWFGAHVSHCLEKGKGSHLNDLICAFSIDTEPLVIFLPLHPPPAAFLSSASANFSFLFTPFLLFFLSPRWQRLELNRQPRQQLALWVGSGLASFINHSSVTGVTVCLQLQICKCYCIHVQRKYERLLLDRSLIIFL